jgi:hypothetical protein
MERRISKSPLFMPEYPNASFKPSSRGEVHKCDISGTNVRPVNCQIDLS